MMIDRIILIVLDGLGIGYMDDAHKYGDEGANTLKHIYESVPEIKIPNLCRLGLAEAAEIDGLKKPVRGSYGRMKEIAPGKDTTSGHWEIAGVKLEAPFPTYPEGFPDKVIDDFKKATGMEPLGNYASSGTEILDQLGEEHMKTGRPIVYTSADSVFQVAAHQDIIPLEKLHKICAAARSILKGRDAVSRVIARPFTGRGKGSFKRNNSGRKDISLPPPRKTLLDILKEAGYISVGIGKIGDIFAHRGLTLKIKTDGNMDGVDKTLFAIEKQRGEKGLIFTNLVDFDTDYGHRRNAAGFAGALQEFDSRLPEIENSLSESDLLMITADHGCDPQFKSHTDHTREEVPILIGGAKVKRGAKIGTRKSFADCGQTVADLFEVEKLVIGESFKDQVLESV